MCWAELLLLLAPALRPEVRPGVWISREEVAALETSGPAWEAVLAAAEKPVTPNLAGRDDDADVYCLAKALVYVRTGQARYETEVRAALRAVRGTERSGDVLALARNLPGYVIAADLVGLPADDEQAFRDWLRGLLDLELDGTTLRRIHERRPNNWGLHAGGARATLARYLDDRKELEQVARVFRGWLGERSAWDGFDFGDLSWQADSEHPVGINPRGAVRDGHSIDGVLPDDQRRAGGFVWPPPKENYVYEALQGALLQAVVLWRAGYATWDWSDRALLRAATWLDEVADFPAEGDDTWQPHLINHFYEAHLRCVTPSRPGKNVGWSDWTFPPARLR